MRTHSRKLENQFINDLDPYIGVSGKTIPSPDVVELDSDEAWQDFQDTNADFDARFAVTDFSGLSI
jgi:hypothetical protein